MMKQLIHFFVVILCCTISYSQVINANFDDITFPPAGWQVFTNGVTSAPVGSWDRTNNPLFTLNNSAGAARAFRATTAVGATRLSWMVTPQFTVPINGQLRFFVRNELLGNQGSSLSIRVSTDADPTNQAAYISLATLSELDVSSSSFQEEFVSLSDFVGQNIYVAFVRSNTQLVTGPNGNGDTWFVDNVQVIEQCFEPENLAVSNLSLTSATLNWSDTGAPQYEVEWFASPNLPTGSGIVVATNSLQISGLTESTAYQFFVRSLCNDGNSNWEGPFTFTTLSPGQNCDAPIFINTIPFSTTNNTQSFGNNFSGNQGSNCGSIFSYLTGNDVVYNYTANFSGLLNITMTPFGTNSGIFVYNSCSNIGVSCIAGVANALATPRVIDLPVVAGQTYILVISTSTPPQTVSYTLNLQQLSCAPPNNLIANQLTFNSATISWGANQGTSFQYVVQNVNAGLPQTDGITTTVSSGITVTQTNSGTPLEALTTYEFYVRRDCGDGTFSTWSGPFAFTTLVTPPACGGLFVDSGGPNGNYFPNSDLTFTICPTVPNEVVTVTFTSFNVEENWDALYVFDGNSITAPQIASTNPAGFVPGGLPGGFWGSTLPGPFISTSPDGCLTFRFRSNGFEQLDGWVANVVCGPPPTCPKPTDLQVSNTSLTSALLSWTEVGPATQWEVLVLPFGSSPPTANTTGTNTFDNPYLASDLSPNTTYVFYVRSICEATDVSLWTGPFTFQTSSVNDECSNAINVPVNPNTSCNQIVQGTLVGATQSIQPINCEGTPHHDVWYQFTATNTTHLISLSNITGNTDDLRTAVYSGENCEELTQLSCSSFVELNTTLNNLTIGAVYYIRIYAFNQVANPNTNFSLCIRVIPPTISTSSATPGTLNHQFEVTDLVQDFLMGDSCVAVSNITSSLSIPAASNSVGYFNNNGSSFPFEEGVILMTGNVFKAPGPNLTYLSDTGANWGGDPLIPLFSSTDDLNNTAFIQFDFVAITNQISFNFIFASDDYGENQCLDNDIFGLFLQELDENGDVISTNNLAVVPNTFPPQPISIFNIRNNVNNPECSSANPQFFGQFSGPTGINPLLSPTNFNGVTVPMTASSAVIPGTSYRIRIAVADFGWVTGDAAVFIERNSLDLGNANLGDDVLICEGDSFVIDSGVSAANFQWAWFKDGVELTGETGSTLVVNEPGVYAVQQTFIGSSCVITDEITVGFHDSFTLNTGNDLFFCSNTDFGVFDLTSNAAVITSNLTSDYVLTYHLAFEDAWNGTEAIMNTSAFENTTNPQTIYVRVQSSITGCFEITSFNISVQDETPFFELTQDATICEGESIELLITAINYNPEDVTEYTWTLNGQPLAFDTPSIIVSEAGLYVATVNVNGCLNSNETTVTVISDIELQPISDVMSCEFYALPELPVGNYFTEPSGQGTQLSAGDLIETTQTLYVFAQVGSCQSELSFVVTIENTQVDTLPDVEICESFTLPVLINGNYFTGSNGTGLQLANGEAITASQTLFIYNTSADGLCSAQSSFEITILSCRIPRGISPNGDGLNDFLDLTNFDGKRISIFNRYGRKVFSQENYTNGWYGQSDSGKELPDGTYYYAFELNNGEVLTGWIYVNRER